MPTTKDAQPQPNSDQTSADIESVRAQLADFLRASGHADADDARPATGDGGGARDDGTGTALNGREGQTQLPASSAESSRGAAWDGDPGPSVQRNAVKIKGRQGGVALEIGEGDWEMLIRLLGERLVGAAGFFRGGQVVLDVGARPLAVTQLRQVARLLEDHEMRLGIVRCTADATQESAVAMGVAVTSEIEEEPAPVPEARSSPPRPAPFPRTGLRASAPARPAPMGAPPRTGHHVHRGNLRSGQVLRKTESVVIIGDVNPGAQVISGGDVMVWGRLRGVAHAGADGNTRAVVTALDFAPTQLRIAGLVTVAPSPKRRLNWRFWKREPARRPESARIVDGGIVVEPWDEAKPSMIAKLRR